MLRRARHWIYNGLRISTLATLAAALWLVWSTPATRLWIDAAEDQISARLAVVFADEFDQAWLEGLLKQELLTRKVNWVLVDSAMQIAEEQGIPLSEEYQYALTLATNRDRGTLGLIDNCTACALGEDSCRMADGLVCAIGIELTPVGDARALWTEGGNYLAGAEVDEINVTLATVGLGATLAILASGGSSAAVKGGVALLRLARKAGRLTLGMQRVLLRMGRNIIRWDRLPGNPLRWLDRKTYRAAINAPVAASAAALAADLNRTRKAMPMSHALSMLAYMDTAGDARRIGKVSTLAGSKSVAAMHRLGKTRVLRMTARLSRVGRTIAGLAWLLATQAAALAAMIAQRMLMRWIRPARA